ncbi:MAG TPA: ATP-binding protein [Thermobifida alba]|nr:ATP-binding protein [Thermobifida alba]
MAQVPSPGEHTGQPPSHPPQAETGSSHGEKSGTRRRLFSRILARFGRTPEPASGTVPYGHPPAPPQAYQWGPPPHHPQEWYPQYPQAYQYPPQGGPQAAPYGYPPAPPAAPNGHPPAAQQAPAAPPAPAEPVEHRAPEQPVQPSAVQEAPAPTGEPAGAEGTGKASASPAGAVTGNDVTGALVNLAMRDLTLVESLLDIVEELEDTTEDSELLAKLFKIDNLATRMRRNGENLLILAGQDIGDPHLEPVSLLDVCRAAISEIGDYERVRLGRMPALFIEGRVSDDLSHLLAELLDNATAKSPDYAQVVISGQVMSEGRLLITVEDEGIGIPEDQLAEINQRLERPPLLEEDVIRHMGMFVVGRIAHRHGFRVQLQARAFRGISAHVVVPTELVGETGPSPESAFETVTTTPVTVSPPPMTPPTQRTQSRDDSGPAFTAAGLPRRGAHRNNQPALPLADPSAEEPSAEPEDAESRAARIRADLEEFLEGERAATGDE